MISAIFILLYFLLKFISLKQMKNYWKMSNDEGERFNEFIWARSHLNWLGLNIIFSQYTPSWPTQSESPLVQQLQTPEKKKEEIKKEKKEERPKENLQPKWDTKAWRVGNIQAVCKERQKNLKKSVAMCFQHQLWGVGQYFPRRPSPLDVLMHVENNLTANLLHSFSFLSPCRSLTGLTGPLLLPLYPFLDFTSLVLTHSISLLHTLNILIFTYTYVLPSWPEAPPPSSIYFYFCKFFFFLPCRRLHI